VLGDDPICSVCLQDFVPADNIRHSIDDGPLGVTAVFFRYRGRVGQAVRRLKYSRATALVDPMSEMMREGVERLGLGTHDLVVPVPIHWSRRSTRGFNQSDLLSERLPDVCRTALVRTRRTKAQARLSREARMSNLAGAFRARPVVRGKSILLVDDVLTSGETARECARALIAAGATEVAIVAFAGEGF
jgi:ComF family protein